MKQDTPKIRFLVCGTVYFLLDDSKEPQSSLVNTILQVPSEHVTAYDIGRAQQQLQMQLDMEIGEGSVITPVRVIINSMSLLGQSTDAVFSAMPQQKKE